MYFLPYQCPVVPASFVEKTIPDLLNYFGACKNQCTIYKHGSISGLSVLFDLFVDPYTNVTLFQFLYVIDDF